MNPSVITIHRSGDRERIVLSLIQGGELATEDEVIDEALRLLREREESERNRVPEGIRQGIEGLNSGRVAPPRV